MTSTAFRYLQAHRWTVLGVLDTSAWFAALYLATGLRLETFATSGASSLGQAPSPVPLVGVLMIAAVAAITHVVLASVLRLHRGRSPVGSLDELLLLSCVVGASGAVAFVVTTQVDPLPVPHSSPVVASFLTFCFAAWARGLWRLVERGRRSLPATAQRTVVVGAGDGGAQLITSMLNDPRRLWNPVAIVDDDPHKKHLRLRGVPVRGRVADLTSIAEELDATTVVIAIPSAGSALVSEIVSQALSGGLDVKVLPGVHQLLDGVSVHSVRDLEPSDLLGRHHVETDVDSIAAYLTGKRVLVTGAGGSIGSELCRQIVRFSPAAVAFLDRDESALHSLALSIDGRADLESENIVLADIRDAVRLEEVFSTFRPDIVFHSAALKHVNVLEHHASEALQTNVWGTLNLLDAAERHEVERFVNISTDKAADPCNVLGYSKRLAERLTADRSLRASGTYLSVRFGNVFGTNGSVIRTFAAQIEAGGPITVTDPNVTRFFMTVDEAVQLVIQAAAVGRDGEALVLDMGEPVSILEIARRMIELSQRDIRVVYTGLKPGEKLHEQLFGAHEHGTAPAHPMITHVAVPPLDPRLSLLIDRTQVNDAIAQAMHDLSVRSASSTSHAS